MAAPKGGEAQALLRARASATLANQDGITPLHIACESEAATAADVVGALIEVRRARG